MALSVDVPVANTRGTDDITRHVVEVIDLDDDKGSQPVCFPFNIDGFTLPSGLGSGDDAVGGWMGWGWSTDILQLVNRGAMNRMCLDPIEQHIASCFKGLNRM